MELNNNRMINYDGMESIDVQTDKQLRGRARAVHEKPDKRHELVKRTDCFQGTNKTKRLACVRCPNKINGVKNRARDTVTFCAKCKVHLHPECFVQYHIDNDIPIVPAEDVFKSPKTPGVSSSVKKRKSSSETSL